MIVTIPARQALLDTQLFTANEVNALSDSEVSMALSMLRGGVPLSVVRGYLTIISVPSAKGGYVDASPQMVNVAKAGDWGKSADSTIMTEIEISSEPEIGSNWNAGSKTGKKKTGKTKK